ncbi:hypothetical protein A2U01_0072467, partial [Trifolium medium]|nr:hypothetical protein [Trifolium medium]
MEFIMHFLALQQIVSNVLGWEYVTLSSLQFSERRLPHPGKGMYLATPPY